MATQGQSNTYSSLVIIIFMAIIIIMDQTTPSIQLLLGGTSTFWPRVIGQSL